MARWTYFLLATVWAFSLEIESACDKVITLKGQTINLFENDNTARSCVQVGECVIGWKKVKKNNEDTYQYEAVAPSTGYIAVGLNDRGTWRLADIAMVTGTTNDVLYRDVSNEDVDNFRPTQILNGQMSVDEITDNGVLRTVGYTRPAYLTSGKTLRRGIYLMCAYGPERNFDQINAVSAASAVNQASSAQWNGGSALSASLLLLLLVTAVAAYLNIQ